jgi:hypothetical protein
MNVFLKLGLGIVALADISRSLLGADAQITYTTNTPAPPNYSAPYSMENSSSNAVMAALSAQALLLKEMLLEHQKRAADLTRTNQIEKAKWETELVTELQEKNVRLQKSIESTMQPRTGSTELKSMTGDVDPQIVFVSSLEARLDQLRFELDAALEDGRLWGMRIGTNKVPEDFAGLSLGLIESQKVMKDLQRERADLELRKLEFQALTKMMQK